MKRSDSISSVSLPDLAEDERGKWLVIAFAGHLPNGVHMTQAKRPNRYWRRCDGKTAAKLVQKLNAARIHGLIRKIGMSEYVPPERLRRIEEEKERQEEARIRRDQSILAANALARARGFST